MGLARDGDSAMLASAISRLGEHRRGRIDQLDSNHLAPLHYAARYAHPDVIKTLLQAGALVNIRGQDELTPLHCAARGVLRDDMRRDDRGVMRDDMERDDKGRDAR
ncbi:hypothetical protein HAZT_HAZT003626 [Hyalella azteca]|uniref:Uncharacterized protein n=1 Tax=Hyalella azteca TaxID=294128 RepID=A0A6A0GUQ7_HYAAZ|nr:hypothetical protein HAZT_HAZT003626 [Hyalella azteca]